ncbi:protein of unknown function [Cupriavidus taiwanensis]|uniref:Uncharacterized protein n=1 Tax=Cupriavidus taiwanensis TaxID=164546 RepID=A0A375G6N0_9BURK|nr:protein of unknown function [Cupriavidus taiwanensis]SOZ05253.1 hypothetical protein CBM2595_A60005 [Cupriavidus taiwanensis]SOZ07385.1 hypothetical protein CBM2597_A70005 [Cupriavidus taiwanensis]SPC14397.1 hypothetical protein CT19431_90003 [Cupriavidus taiwanensis]SPC15227.1 hypothetical protein CBM2594_A50005 [Cupriavidus taiwanensis]
MRAAPSPLRDALRTRGRILMPGCLPCKRFIKRNEKSLF